MPSCVFCQIARGDIDAVLLHEDAEILAFLDTAPIRKGHAQIIPRRHFETFEILPPDLAAHMVAMGQRLARRMKAVYRVERVAFAFTGGDVAHAHAHVIPLHDKTDVTSARYLVGPAPLQFATSHLRVDRETLMAVRDELAFLAGT